MWFKAFIALSMLVTVSLAASAHKRPFRSIKAPIETIQNYDVVLPTITYQDSNETYPKVIHVTLTTSTMETYSLVLEKNEVLLSRGFVSRHYDENGGETLTKGHDNCYYQGHVLDKKDWIVTMTTCHGLQGEFGDLDDETKLYHIEPLDTQDKSLNQLHALYLDSEYKVKGGGCGSDHNSTGEHHGMDLPKLDGVELHDIHRRQSSDRTRYVELVIVNDHRQYQSNNRNLESTVQRAVTIANRVDELYRPLGIRVVLIEVITWTDRDRITVSSDPNTLLDNFRSYRRQISTVHDAAICLTGIDLTGNTIGIAFTGTMCSDRSSVGVSQDGGRSVSSTASITAHELGHIFSMPHDGTSCTCNDPSRRCIMSAVSGFPAPTRWSSCSVDSLNRGYSRGLDRCLFNEPTTTVGDPVCGNGIREGDEVCDCGKAEECTDPCCNAATCKLADGAECSAGGCCTNSCKFKARGTTCRASSGECDITEYCTGDSNECPTDEHKIDRTPCKNNAGFCYSGSCPTHDEQCGVAFGSRKGNINCYSQGNIRGDQFGNCGSTSSSFVRCASGDVQCGQLQCSDGEFRASVNTFVTILNLGVFDRSTRRVETCRSYTTQPGGDTLSPGLVADGTKCGDGRVCDMQRCVAATISNQCGRGSNGQICSGNGVCNNRGRCSCNVEFTGSVCQTPVNGDVNECETDNGGCAHVCTNTDGSFRCSCRTGYTLASNGRTCNDINECASRNGGCDQVCSNNAGSFSCSCRTGYTLASNGRNCNDINECASRNGGCDQVCSNNAGSFSCSCRTGFTLASNGRTCNDVNECASNNGGCEQICVNTGGSFQCSCRTGFTLNSNGRTCTADVVIPPAPVDVSAFCSAVNWRSTLSSCEDTVTSYQVQFYVPGTSQAMTKTISDSNTFHYVIQQQDTFNVPQTTFVRVRARNSAGVSAWSSGTSIGCREECVQTPPPTPPPTTPPTTRPTTPPTQRPTEPPSVQFSLKGRTYANNSVIPITEIGEGDNALLCTTDKAGCCATLPNRFGDFYYPGGNKVPNNARGEGFFRGRGTQLVRLSRRSGVTSPRGVFRCEVPDNDGVTQKVYIRLS